MRKEKQAHAHQEHVVLGMAAGMGAYFMFSVMVLFAKLLSANHSVIEIAFYRNLIGSVPFLFVVFALGRRDILVLRTRPVMVGFRAILGSISLVVTFWAFSLMPLADTTALLFTSSLFIPILGVVFLKEVVGPYRWSAVVIGFAGVIIMARPTGDVYVLGISVALPFVAVTPTTSEIPLLFGVGLSGAAAQWFLSIAYKNAPAAVVTVFNYTSIIWATLFGWMIWNEWPLPAVIAGAAIVIAANILIVWRESRLMLNS